MLIQNKLIWLNKVVGKAGMQLHCTMKLLGLLLQIMVMGCSTIDHNFVLYHLIEKYINKCICNLICVLSRFQFSTFDSIF